MPTFSARSPKGNEYQTTSKTEHVRLLAQGYEDTTRKRSKQAAKKPEPAKQAEPKPAETAKPDAS